MTLKPSHLKLLNLNQENGHTLEQIKRRRDDTASIIIFTDAFLEGWRAVSNDICIKGTSSESYIDEIIAIKEMLAIEYATAFFINEKDNLISTENKYFTIKSDSLVCVYLLQRGGTPKGPRSVLFNKILKYIPHNIGEHRVSFENTLGTLNTKADHLSRKMIKKEVVFVGKEKRTFLKTLFLQKFVILKTHYDLFASNANKMFSNFFSLYSQPHIMGMNSFLFHWQGREKFYYIFSPLNMILKTLNKLSLHSLREKLERDLSVKAATTILSRWSDNTKKVYSSTCFFWLIFCKSQQREVCITFLLQLSGRLLSEREKELVQRTLKGSTELSLLSELKKIDNTIWNFGEFLETIQNLPDTDDPIVSNIQFFDSHTIFHITVSTKTKPREFNLRINNISEEEVFCAIATFRRYMTITNNRRIDDNLFVTLMVTKKRVTTSTIQRQIKHFLLKGNVDACTHSISKSSSSWLFQKGITAEKIKSLCNWSKQCSTWEKFYYKDIAETNVLETLKL
uniref:Tyr recombinase domain-containing protein n=1 Tax=Strongyloides venezuelensis TaxID=75913 RepID=A0A0K0FUN0_STRVS